MPGEGTPVMRIRVWSILVAAVVLLVGASRAGAQTPPPPVIFFTDLQSGPNSGGETVGGFSGAYVTLYGNFFGATQGSSTVTLNGASCLRAVQWGTTWLWYQKLIVQLGPSCVSGNFVVTVGGISSNSMPFTVRLGNIFCVSTTGSDSNNGKFPSSCWATVSHANSSMSAGDTTYVENGINETANNGFSAVISIQKNPGGTASNPIAIIGYPGATATIGAIAGPAAYAIRVPQSGVSPAYYVLAGLTLRGGEALEIFQFDHLWMIGLDISCNTNGFGCVHVDVSNNTFLYGNNVHDIVGAAKLYHAVYYTTNSSHSWVGWNVVDPDPTHSGAAGCRGIQYYSTGGTNQFDIHVHDNIIRNTICDGLNLNTVDSGLGLVEAYNNVIYHAGTGPPPQGQESSYACIYTSTSGTATGQIELYNNTLYDCGSRGSQTNSNGGFSVVTATRLRNNVFESTGSGEQYLTSNSSSLNCASFSGSNNDWFGNGAPLCPAQITANSNFTPLYTSTTLGSQNLTPQTGSLLFGAGVPIASMIRDITGAPRASSPAIGAYDSSAGGGTAQRPNPPINLVVTVH
jgi:hypothetical protein